MPRGIYERKRVDPLARFMARVEVQPSGCWLWMGARTQGDYALFPLTHSKQVLAHRWAYEVHVGPIPAGYTIDHVKSRGCVSTLCVFWGHLEPVPHRENLMRGKTMAAANAAKTHCPSGHAYDASNTKIKRDGARSCRTCARLYKRRRDAEKRERRLQT